MAALPNSPLVPVEKYLNSGYRPDMEYVDGLLQERSLPTIAHSLLQMILLRWFIEFEKALQFLPLPEVRTQIVECARYRIPDVALVPVPLPSGRVITTVPWVIFEILSPDDRTSEQLERFRDYQRIGVGHVIVLDPERLLAYRFDRGSLIQSAFTALELPTGTLPFRSQELFRQLSEKQAQGAR